MRILRPIRNTTQPAETAIAGNEHLQAFPEPLSCRGSLPRTLLLMFADDHSNHTITLPDSCDHFMIGNGNKAQRLVAWFKRFGPVVAEYDYVLLVDEGIALSSKTLGRIARTAREYDLPVSSAGHCWRGGISRWPHMMVRGAGRRMDEPAAGVELCNLIDPAFLLMETAACWRLFEALDGQARPGMDVDMAELVSSACYSDLRPFGVMHHVCVRTSPRPKRGIRSVSERLSSARLSSTEAPLKVNNWLPAPRIRCINLERAVERRDMLALEWVNGVGAPVKLFKAVDRRDLESGRIPVRYDSEAAIRRIGRGLSWGEVACALSHALVIYEEMEFCGPEGVIIMEDDCRPIPSLRVAEIYCRINRAVIHHPDMTALICHKPWGNCAVSEPSGDAVRVNRPPWGSVMLWYSRTGLEHAVELLSKMDQPADWIWREFSVHGQLAML